MYHKKLISSVLNLFIVCGFSSAAAGQTQTIFKDETLCTEINRSEASYSRSAVVGSAGAASERNSEINIKPLFESPECFAEIEVIKGVRDGHHFIFNACTTEGKINLKEHVEPGQGLKPATWERIKICFAVGSNSDNKGVLSIEFFLHDKKTWNKIEDIKYVEN